MSRSNVWRKRYGLIVFLIVAIISNYHTSGPRFAYTKLSHDAFSKTAAAYLNYETRSFAVLRGADISLKYAAEDEAYAPFMLEAAEGAYRKLQEKLAYYPLKERVLIIAYPDRRSLADSLGLGGERSADGAYWAGTIRLLSLRALTPSELPLVHELTHYLVDKKTGGNYPRWLTEGLAQYLEREISGYVLTPPDLDKMGIFYPLSSLDRDFDRQDQAVAYWQSLAAVDYLIDEYGFEKMQNLLTILGRGKAVERAVYDVYGIRPEELDEEIKNRAGPKETE